MISPERGVEIRRLAVYGVVGTLNTALCYALFALLAHGCAWHYRYALAADYAFGLVLGYVLHRVSTFADRKHLRQAFGKYTITLAATFVLNFLLLDAIVQSRLLGPVAAQAVAMIAVTMASYLAQKQWVFRSYVRATAPVQTEQPSTDGDIAAHSTRRSAA
jgi:putative flippase GtrA